MLLITGMILQVHCKHQIVMPLDLTEPWLDWYSPTVVMTRRLPSFPALTLVLEVVVHVS
jgi:hypothetical protein